MKTPDHTPEATTDDHVEELGSDQYRLLIEDLDAYREPEIELFNGLPIIDVEAQETSTEGEVGTEEFAQETRTEGEVKNRPEVVEATGRNRKMFLKLFSGGLVLGALGTTCYLYGENGYPLEDMTGSAVSALKSNDESPQAKNNNEEEGAEEESRKPKLVGVDVKIVLPEESDEAEAPTLSIDPAKAGSNEFIPIELVLDAEGKPVWENDRLKRVCPEGYEVVEFHCEEEELPVVNEPSDVK